MWKGSSYLKSGGLYDFLPGPLHPQWMTMYLEFQFTATNFMSMAAKLSDLVDKMSGANLQVDGHVEVPTQGAKDLWKMEEEDSSPSHNAILVSSLEAAVQPP